MNEQQTPEKTTDSEKKSALIPEGFYPWFLGGVLLGGAVVLPIALFHLMEGMSALAAWVCGVVSSVVFLLCLDTRGNFRWITAIPAIAVATIAANVYNQNTGQPVVVLGGLAGFVIFAVFGAIGVGIGKQVRGRQCLA